MPSTRSDRERRHQARLDAINRVQCVAGSADDARVDHEETLLERARLLAQELRVHAATEDGIAAFERLLRAAESDVPEQRRAAALFLRALRDDRPLGLAVMRMADEATGDDMLAVLDAWRFARVDLAAEVRGGTRRLARVLAAAD